MKRFVFSRAAVLGLLGLGIVLMIGCSDEKEPTTPGDPEDYVNADGLNGGQLYDKFWASETGWNQTDPNLSTYNDFKNFFRCKQCHGWDLLGNQGAYIGRGPSTTRPNVTSLNLRTLAAGRTPQELFDAMKRSTGRRGIDADLSTYDPDANRTVGDQMPDYGTIFSDAQIWDVVKFLKEEAIDTALLYDSQTTGSYPDGSIEFSNIGKDGDASNGDTLFSTKCASCHGSDGALILVDGGGYTVGSHVRAKPYEDHHKIKFGQLGSSPAMGSLLTDVDEIKDVFKALTDDTNYPDPTGP